MSGYADLHMHTHFSDGTQSPEEVVVEAKEKELCCIAITDHDIVDGIAPAIKAGELCGVEVVPGVELSSVYKGRDIHILGYYMDYENDEFLKAMNEMQNSRMARMEKMVKKINELGVADIDIQEVCDLASSKAVGRPHLAMLLEQKGAVKNIKAAFDKYLADDKPAYVPKFEQTPFQAIKFIKRFNGVPVLAHPMITNVDELIPRMVAAGLAGLEAYYPYHNEKITENYLNIAQKHHLIVTGGSDAHGEAKTHTFIGKVKVPYALVEALKEVASK